MKGQLVLVNTCESVPEQYDVFLGEEIVGYLRLRNGHFRAHLHGPEGDVVYEADTRGDGCFEDDERDLHLAAAIARLAAAIAEASDEQLSWTSRRDAVVRRRFEHYVGDGAYVYLDAEGCVVLYTSNGIRETNRVVLEPEVLLSFEQWVERVKRDLQEKRESV